jgi:hypothetical protein
MFFEDDVKESVKAGLEGHLRFYVDTYLYEKNTDKDRADYRGHIINQEQSLLARSPDDSARLRVIEYLDSHPHEKQQAIDYVGVLHRAETMPTMSSAQPHSEAGAVLQEQLHRLEGGFLIAVVQGVYNEYFHDPAVALDKAGLAVTIVGLVETAAEAKAVGIESANRFHEDHLHRGEFVQQAGKEEVNRSIAEIGGKSTAENWPNTARELGSDRIHELENNLGKAETADLIRELHPGKVPGDSAWPEGNIRHPEFFAPGAEKHEGSAENRGGHAGDGKTADGSTGFIPMAHAPEHPAHSVDNPSANQPSDKSQPEQQAHRPSPHESGMSIPEHLVPHAPHHHHASESGMSVPEPSHPGSQYPVSGAMNLPLDSTPHHGGHAAHQGGPPDTGMSVPESSHPGSQYPVSGAMNLPLDSTPHHGGHAAHQGGPPDTGMSVPESSHPGSQYPVSGAMNLPLDSTPHHGGHAVEQGSGSTIAEQLAQQHKSGPHDWDTFVAAHPNSANPHASASEAINHHAHDIGIDGTGH